jgi:anthranilate synthase component 1
MKFQLRTRQHQLLADLFTPVGLYLALRDRFPGALLLESSELHTQQGRLSLICCDPLAAIRVEHGRIHRAWPDGSAESEPVAGREQPARVTRSGGSTVAAALQAFLAAFQADAVATEYPHHALFGYTAYDAVAYFEDVELHAPQAEEKRIPDLAYALYRFVLVFDHLRQTLSLFEHSVEGMVYAVHLEDVLAALHHGNTPRFRFAADGAEQSNLTDEAYKQLVTRGKSECQRGNVFQVVLSREFSRAFRGDEFNVYRALRSINPSPYLFFFDYGNFRLFGSSPEAQLVVGQGRAEIHPIAGTVRRTGDAAADRARAEALRRDAKEQSEHVMLVDLARNDLARHCTGVQVDVFAETQHFSHVIHLVSKVTGAVGAAASLDVFATTFPAGTLSGAPKHRALQIIDACENDRRGYYGGAVGYIGLNGDLHHAIIIRSFLSKNNRLYCRAGAGVVVQSTEEGELQEVNNKLAALRKAIELAGNIA